ncbi:MAG: hypothetical protein Q8L14_29245 [Myxococcales bacterium]|nr:hypothetical protein [Myxococcales bacterium]
MMLMVLVTTVAAQRPVLLPDAGCAAVRVAESPCGSTLWACVDAFSQLGSGGGTEGVTARFMVGSATDAGTDPGRELNLVEEEVAFSRLPLQEEDDASSELFAKALARCTAARGPLDGGVVACEAGAAAIVRAAFRAPSSSGDVADETVTNDPVFGDIAAMIRQAREKPAAAFASSQASAGTSAVTECEVTAVSACAGTVDYRCQRKEGGGASKKTGGRLLLCVPDQPKAARAAFARHAAKKQWQAARDLLEPLLEQCADRLDFEPRAWLRNELAVTLHHLKQDEACRSVLGPLEVWSSEMASHVSNGPWPEPLRALEKATNTNFALCGR